MGGNGDDLYIQLLEQTNDPLAFFALFCSYNKMYHQRGQNVSLTITKTGYDTIICLNAN